MNGIRAWMLRLILCGFLVSLAGALCQQPRIKRLAALCGGCLLLVTALQPLLRIDWEALPDRLAELGLEPAAISAEEAKERNEALLETLVERQTAEWIQKKAESRAASIRVEVEARRDPESGLPEPYSVRIAGALPAEVRAELAEVLERELGIPAERQVWVPP